VLGPRPGSCRVPDVPEVPKDANANALLKMRVFPRNRLETGVSRLYSFWMDSGGGSMVVSTTTFP
jgi:hypothetical protein